MLILMRREGERIIIGDHVTITVMGIQRPNQVTLRIEAPKDIPVDREEVHSKKREEQGLPPLPHKAAKK